MIKEVWFYLLAIGCVVPLSQRATVTRPTSWNHNMEEKKSQSRGQIVSTAVRTGHEVTFIQDFCWFVTFQRGLKRTPIYQSKV